MRPAITSSTTLTFLVCLLCLSAHAFADKKEEKKQQAAQLTSALDAMDIRKEGSQAFKLSASITLIFASPIQGTYRLQWASPGKWREEINIPGYAQTTVRNGDQEWITRSMPFPPLRVLQLLRLFSPRAGISASEGDSIAVEGMSERKTRQMHLNCATVKYGKNNAVTHSEFCVSTSSLLFSRTGVVKESSDDSDAAEFEDYLPFSGRRYPRTQRVTEGARVVAEAHVDTLEAIIPDEGIFSGLSGVESRTACDDMKPPLRMKTPNPEFTSEARANGIQGSNLIWIALGSDGTVRDAAVLQTLGSSLDQATIAKIKQWKFQPAMCGRTPVPTEISAQISFHKY